MTDNTIRIPLEVLDADGAVMIEITDPTDGTRRTFTGPDEATVNRQIDAFWGISAADEAEAEAAAATTPGTGQ
jgi:hypothetical protein